MHQAEVPVALALRSAAGALPAPPPEAGRVVLQLAFFRTLQHLLNRADQQLLDGAPVDLDELAQVIASHLRPNLLLIHGGPVVADSELEAARESYLATLEASRRGDPEASANLFPAYQRFAQARRVAGLKG